MLVAVLGKLPAGRRMLLSRIDSYTETCCPLHTATYSPEAATPLMVMSVSNDSADFLKASTTRREEETYLHIVGQHYIRNPKRLTGL